jgi:Domain of Unknown Function (DUF1080)
MKKKNWILIALVVALPAGAADPPSKKPVETFTDPDKAGPDFQVQGEYVGEAAPGVKWGAQVVAEGDGTFACRLIPGGLPGDGGKTEHLDLRAETVDGKVKGVANATDGGSAVREIGGGKLNFRNGNVMVLMSRVVRHSPTEGAKPPAGAVVLFDGTGADAWDHGKIENGLLSVSVPGGQTSKRTFADCTVHAEFILPFMPRARGQARGNSGVYLQGRYETQVLDSFGLESKDNECGGIYEVRAPKINMCYPPLQWQTYDIDFAAARYGADGKKTADARITVRHNGVLVQEQTEIPHETRAAVLKDGPEPGPIHLQNHGNPIFYRNVWVVEKK